MKNNISLEKLEISLQVIFILSYIKEKSETLQQSPRIPTVHITLDGIKSKFYRSDMVYILFFLIGSMPNMRLELMTLRLRVAHFME